MDKLRLKRQNLGRVFNSRHGRACLFHAIAHITKQPNLQLKTRPKQLLSYLPLTFVLPTETHKLQFLSAQRMRSFPDPRDKFGKCSQTGATSRPPSRQSRSTARFCSGKYSFYNWSLRAQCYKFFCP
jgi:hypothetical protein